MTRIISRSEMGEKRDDPYMLLVPQHLCQQVCLTDTETQPVHPCVNFQMNRIMEQAVPLCILNEAGIRFYAVDLRFEVMTDDQFHHTLIRIHHHNRGCYARFPECYSLISISHRKITDMIIFKK